ncbi:MAG TPA: NlpC/P60 family protein [Candidatus Bathyarchaeia archaeon]|nr:NlpC/P60 family protein [Candidatus Bathyarchaeia archaeon]
MIVAVAVATVWTSPESPKERDLPALQNPVQLREWINPLTIEDRLSFWADNQTQTQILYGRKVIVDEERGEWVKVIIPDQSCKKDERGYPGWVPKRQLIDAPEYEQVLNSNPKLAVVSANTAFLYINADEPEMEISFLTSLPLLDTDAQWTQVLTPHGPRLLKTSEVQVVDGKPSNEGNVGQSIVNTAKRFLNLHYLWGGMSAFGYDCSGFAHSMHLAHGIVIPRDASDQAQSGTWVEKEDLLPGDLLFFAHEEGKGRVHHVGIYAGDHQMIHSPDSRHAIELISLAGYKLEKEHCISRRYW